MKDFLIKLPMILYTIPFIYLNYTLFNYGFLSTKSELYGLSFTIFLVLAMIQTMVYLTNGKNANIKLLLEKTN